MNIIGNKYGLLTVVQRADDHVQSNGRRRIMWECSCECGMTKIVLQDNLVAGRVQSCGCSKNRMISEKHIKHGDSKSRLYNIWTGIKTRCRNQNCSSYKDYGARGIDICNEWESYDAFASWATNNGYEDDLSIDRIDNDIGYSPSNCRWVDKDIQNNNKRSNRLFTIGDETHTLKQWADLFGVRYKLVHQRIQAGWNIRRALNIDN